MKISVRRWACVLLALCMALSLAACNQGGGSKAGDLVNGDFEEVDQGKWVGWTREDAAFNFRGVVTEEKINGVTMEKTGEHYFAGSVGGNPPCGAH